MAFRGGRQRGAALIVMMVILVLAASWYLVSALGSINRTAAVRSQNGKALLLAKQALLGWAAQNAFDSAELNPGRLPCPEALGNIQNPPSANEGVMQGFCAGGSTAVGRFPWRSVGIEKPYDADGQVLWYVVSPGWKVPNSTSPTPPLGLNSNSAGQLTVNGQANAAVALIIAPGAPLTSAPDAAQLAAGCAAGTQSRTSFPPTDSSAYLECQNIAGASLRTTVVDNTSNPVFNDQVVVITAAEVMAAIEPAVAARISRDVLPALQTAFDAPYSDAAQWGASASVSTPLLPFGVPFTGGPAQPTANQGGLPLTRSQGCTAGTDPLCDPNFVRWDAGSILVEQVNSGNDSATLDGSSCTGSDGTQIRCTISYSGTCGGFLNLGFLLGGSCNLEMKVSVKADAENVGRALRTFTTAGITGFSSLASHATPIDSTGTAKADIQGNLPNASCSTFILFGFLVPCNASKTVSITIPISVFADDPNLTAFFGSTERQWFIDNRWYEVMYYAVSPSHSPLRTASFDCRAAMPASDCITVAGTSDWPTNVRALTGLMGHSLSSQPRPNTTLGDYLESGNADGNTQFEKKVASRTFDDWFFSVSRYAP